MGHISTGGWFLGATALFDVLDGTVARRSNKSSTFGAFLDSSLDRVADGAVLSGLAVFYALNPVHHNVPMMAVCLLGLIGAYMTSIPSASSQPPTCLAAISSPLAPVNPIRAQPGSSKAKSPPSKPT